MWAQTFDFNCLCHSLKAEEHIPNIGTFLRG
jgi:hypothetical protein